MAWSRIINTTTRKYIRQVEMNILRNRVLTAMLKAKGRFTFNWTGERMDWKVNYRRALLDAYADGDTLTFARKDRWRTASLGWRGYAMTDAMTKVETLMNKGQEAIINVYAQIAPALMSDIEDWFSEELYLDGDLAANFRRIHGIESFMGVTGGSVGTSTSPIPYSAGSPGYNDTFAGLSTVLGGVSGTWSGTWPSGKGTPDYDYNTPIIVDTGCAYFSATNTWRANCLDALRYAIIKSQRSKSAKGKLDFILLDDDMYRDSLNAWSATERTQVQSNTGIRAFGFSNTFNFDGVDVTWEYGMPAGTGYGFNCNEMEVRSMQGQLFEADGPIYDQVSRTWRFSVDFIGNAVWNPKFFLKLYNYTNPGG